MNPETALSIQDRTNKLGLSYDLNLQFIFVKITNHSPVKVLVRHKATNKTKECFFGVIYYQKSNPFKHYLTNKERIQRATKVGMSFNSKAQYKCLKSTINNHNENVLTLKHLLTKKLKEVLESKVIYNRYNPWAHKNRGKISNPDKKSLISKIGMSFPKDKQFICIEVKNKKNTPTRVVLKHLASGDTAEVAEAPITAQRCNPWRFLSSKQIMNRNTKVGMSFSKEEQFKCIGIAGFKGSNRYVIIQHLMSGKKEQIVEQNVIKNRSNPWRISDLDRHEETIVHPKYKKFFKKIGIKFLHEERISKESRPDFICMGKQGIIIVIEVKSDEKVHSVADNQKQISRYSRDAKNKYGNRYAKTYLSSPKGKYGLSIKSLQKELKQQGFI